MREILLVNVKKQLTFILGSAVFICSAVIKLKIVRVSNEVLNMYLLIRMSIQRQDARYGHQYRKHDYRQY